MDFMFEWQELYLTSERSEHIFGSGHALLLKSLLFQNAVSHMLYSNLPSFTPSLNV